MASFEYLYKDEHMRGYDRAVNKDGFSCWQLSADGMAWCDGDRRVRMFHEKGVACALPGRSGFAVVEFGLDSRNGRLYFIDEDETVLPHGPIPDKLSRFVPYDVFVAEALVKVIFVDPAVGQYDAQVDYDPADLKVVRWGPWK